MKNKKVEKSEEFKFDFKIDIKELEEIKEKYTNINEKNKIDLNEAISELVSCRTKIEKVGLSLRKESNDLNKLILKEEKIYKNIIEPLEIKYKGILKKIIEYEENFISFPQRKLNLLNLEKIEQPTDDFIMSMNNEDFYNFYNEKVKENNDLIELEKYEKFRNDYGYNDYLKYHIIQNNGNYFVYERIGIFDIESKIWKK